MLKIVAALCLLTVIGGQAVPHGSTSPADAAALLRNPLALTTGTNQGRYLNHYSDPSYLRALGASGASNYLTRPDDLYSRERELLLRQSYNRFGQYPGTTSGSYNYHHQNSNYPYTATGYPYHNNNYNYYGQNPYNQNRLYSGYNYNKNSAAPISPYDSLNNGLYDSRYYL